MTRSTLPPPFLPADVVQAIRRSVDGRAVYVVGGYVRDALLRRPALDLDLAVDADPRAVARRLAAALGGAVFPLSAEHGVWRVTVSRVGGDSHIDLSPVRGTLEADLLERDFTVNAIAATLDGQLAADPTGGVRDLEHATLRLVTTGAIQADPVRSLRAVRHACELGFSIDTDSAAIIRRDAAELRRTAGERQRDELMRTFDTERAADGVRLLDSLRLLDITLPELTPSRGCAQPVEHYWDVLTHAIETVAVLDCLLARGGRSAACEARSSVLWREWGALGLAPTDWQPPLGEGRSRRSLLKLIGLLHDVAKPETKTVDDDGRVRFFGHPERGAVLAAEAMRRLRFSSREIALAQLLIREHLRPGQLAPLGESPTPRAVYRLYRDLGDAVPDLLLLNLADGAAAAGPRQTPAQWAAHVRYAAWLLRQPLERESITKPARLVTGHDLMQHVGLEPGPELGRILAALAEAEGAGEITTRDAALERARSLADARSS